MSAVDGRLSKQFSASSTSSGHLSVDARRRLTATLCSSHDPGHTPAGARSCSSGSCPAPCHAGSDGGSVGRRASDRLDAKPQIPHLRLAARLPCCSRSVSSGLGRGRQSRIPGCLSLPATHAPACICTYRKPLPCLSLTCLLYEAPTEGAACTASSQLPLHFPQRFYRSPAYLTLPCLPHTLGSRHVLCTREPSNAIEKDPWRRGASTI